MEIRQFAELDTAWLVYLYEQSVGNPVREVMAETIKAAIKMKMNIEEDDDDAFDLFMRLY